MEDNKVESGTCRVRIVRVALRRMPADPSERTSSPASAARFLTRWIGSSDREQFAVLHVDALHTVVSAEIVSIGTLISSLIHPREVFKAAFLANACSIICGHNHPSGRCDPSREDLAVLSKLRSAGELLGVPLLDFVIVGQGGYWSARESTPDLFGA